MDIIDYNNYKKYIIDWLENQPQKGYGLKSRLSEHLKCRQSYLSKVLQDSAELSSVQALRAANFLGLNREEGRFFRLLVEIARAETFELKDELMLELQELKNILYNLKRKLPYEEEQFSDKEKLLYYKSWHISAIHMALIFLGTKSTVELARLMDVSIYNVNESIQILLKLGLIRKAKNKYIITDKKIHLDKNSSIITYHLSNIRIRVLEEMQQRRDESLHFSAIISLSKEDALKIEKILRQAVEKTVKTLSNSDKEDSLYLLNIDWFSLLSKL